MYKNLNTSHFKYELITHNIYKTMMSINTYGRNSKPYSGCRLAMLQLTYGRVLRLGKLQLLSESSQQTVT